MLQELRLLRLLPLLYLLAPGVLPGGQPQRTAMKKAAVRHDPGVPVFSDVSQAAGIRFRQGLGGKRPLTILEATGSGCAFLDYDNDGWLDLFLAGQPRCALYHNNRNGTFTDITQTAGLAREGFWIGCGTGDYDNDGHV